MCTLVLQETEKMPLGTTSSCLMAHIDLTCTASHLHANHSYLMLHILDSLTFFLILHAEWYTN